MAKPKGQQQAEKELWCKLENGGSDKRYRKKTGEHRTRKEGSCDKVDQITASSVSDHGAQTK